mgnify:CR=1 FL=1
MLTSGIWVNGEMIERIDIVNDGTGATGQPLVGIASYRVQCFGLFHSKHTFKGIPLELNSIGGRVENWDRSRPAHELVEAARKACMAAIQ